MEGKRIFIELETDDKTAQDLLSNFTLWSNPDGVELTNIVSGLVLKFHNMAETGALNGEFPSAMIIKVRPMDSREILLQRGTIFGGPQPGKKASKPNTAGE